ncbi:pseudouridine synthase [Parasphingorhabdus sp.]|uniref:pseudouridine synthase n=1 Tax=Parasphingorhabdus sp. TaxID=2709688 RepID=UPI003001C3AC
MTEDKPAKIYRAKPTPGAKAPAAPKPPAGDAREGQRIAKLLARAGVASRREIERMIEAGRVALNGELVEHPSLLLKNLTGITVDGKPVAEPSPAKLFRFHKPNGYLTAERDFSGKKTIYDVLPADMERIMPIGRLDMNTEGLLLMTTDGEFKRQMELPKNGIERTYRARTFGDISQNQLEELYRGITIDGMHYSPITANLERRTGRNQWIEMTLTEGKNREVRKVLEHFGLEVSRLIRTRYGPFVLGDLQKGEIDQVRQHDLVQFRKSLK